MSTDAIQRARQAIEATLWAAVLASPLDSGLTERELCDAVHAAWPAIGPGAIRDALTQHFTERWNDHLLTANSSTWAMLLVDVNSVPEELFPRSSVIVIGRVFDEAENQQGQGCSLDVDTLAARAKLTPDAVALAVGTLCALRWLARTPKGFKRAIPWGQLKTARPHEAIDEYQRRGIEQILQAKPVVVNMFRQRSGDHAPLTKPTTRFAAYLSAVGWSGMHVWWTETVREMEALDNASPTAIGVLCGALLEAALVAVAIPARDAKEWRQKFLSEQQPSEWKLGKLIDQAEDAKVFTASQKAMADVVMTIRNRIHAGKFATADGKLSPPYANQHEARQARDNLDALLVAIVEWPFIQSRLLAPTSARPPS